MNVLFINSRAPECGVHQFGLNLFRILQGSEKHDFYYTEPDSDEHLTAMIAVKQADIVFYNFYPCTMPWITLQTLNKVRARGLRQLTIHHEVPVTGFDAFIYPDPTFTEKSLHLNYWFRMGRPLPAAAGKSQIPNPKSQGKGKGKKAKKISRVAGAVPMVPIIGSAGFGFGWKGHQRLVGAVLTEFTQAKIRLHLPFAAHGDADGAGARAIADECRALVARGNPNMASNIELEISHDFMEPAEFVKWLAGNDLNAYLYDNTPESRGIASTIDHALAARKPIAITKSWMFRHLHQLTTSICIEDSSLGEIMANGIAPLEPVYYVNSEKNVRAQIEKIFDIQQTLRACKKPLNRLLSNKDRDAYGPRILEMEAQIPELIARKIPEANVQQAWTLEMVRETNARRILCVGCFEDSAYESLLKQPSDAKNFDVLTGIDPQAPINAIELAEFRQRFPEERFDCVFATSVIEHVQDDEQFIRDICAVLVQDGVALLTCDFKADWKPGDPLPAEDVRFYTPADYERLAIVLESQACYFLERPKLEGAPDFHYHGHDYSFATMVFKHL